MQRRTLPDLANDINYDQSLFNTYLEKLQTEVKIQDKQSPIILDSLEKMIGLMNKSPDLITDDADKIIQALQFINRCFFEWNDYQTILFSKKMVDEIEKLLSIFNFVYKKSNELLKELATLQYKLGAFYAHIRVATAEKSSVDCGYHHLISLKNSHADTVMTKQEKAWVNLHIAYLCQQKITSAIRECRKNKFEVESKECEENRSMALKFCDEVLSDTVENEEDNKILAFAHCVRALIFYEQVKQNEITLLNAMKEYDQAFKIYISINACHDGDQYARALSRSNSIKIDYIKLLIEKAEELRAGQCNLKADDVVREINKYISDVKTSFFELEQNHWMKTTNPNTYYHSETFTAWVSENKSPYPARFLKAFAEFYEMEGEYVAARTRYNAAYQIACEVEGKDSSFAKDLLEKSKPNIQTYLYNDAKLFIFTNPWTTEAEAAEEKKKNSPRGLGCV